MRNSLGLLLFLSLTVAACSGPVDDQKAGFDAFQSKDYESAVTHLEAALATTPKADSAAKHKLLTLAACKAKAHTDATAALADFKAFAASTEFDAKDVSDIVREFVAANAFEEGLEVLDAGLKKYSEDANLATLLATFQKLSASNPGLGDALKGLGYTGD